MIVPRGPSESEHRIFFDRFKVTSTGKPGILIGLEVAHANDHRSRIERSGYHRQGFAELFNKVPSFIIIAGRRRLDQIALRAIGDLFRVDERHGVNTDGIGDGKLHAHQSHTGGRISGQPEYLVGIGKDEHGLCARTRQIGKSNGLDMPVEMAIKDLACIAPFTDHGDGLSIGQSSRSITRTDHGMDAEFARHDRGMTGASASGGDDARGVAEHRVPIGVCRFGYDHIALLHAGGICQPPDNAHCSAGDATSNGDAAQDRGRMACKVDLLLDKLGCTTMYRLGSGLHHKQLIGDSVTCPLNVHRHAVVIFDGQTPASDAFSVLVSDRHSDARSFA